MKPSVFIGSSSEALGLAKAIKKQLPVHYRERTAGVSKMKSLRHTINLLRMCWKGFRQVKTFPPLPRATPEEEASPAPSGVAGGGAV